MTRRGFSIPIVVIFALLAGCSGGGRQVTPATQSAQYSAPGAASMNAAVTGGEPNVRTVSAADFAVAHTMVPGTPHFMHTVQNNPTLAVRLPAAPVGYPFDMSCGSSTCPVMRSSTAYNVYVSTDGIHCLTESCWGNPEEFLKGLTGSTFASLVSQYTGGGPLHYTFGGSMAVTYPYLKYSNTFYNNDLFTILAAAVSNFGASGLSAQYHIFLPPGKDTCFDQTGYCYSPDNIFSFVFCAYHSYVTVGGKRIIYSVEPWQNATVDIGGYKFYACQNTFIPSGFSRLNSSTASTLSHESFESWSDPLPGSGWYNFNYGDEIGDVCAYTFMQKLFLSTGKFYTQQEYSNIAHGCASGR